MSDTNEKITPADAVGRDQKDQQLAEQLVDRAKSQGLDLVGRAGVRTRLTKTVLEAGLEAELSEHLGYDKHYCLAGRDGATRATAPDR